MNTKKNISKEIIKTLVKNALAEDKTRSDITTRSLIKPNLKADFEIIFKEKGIICGMDMAKEAFQSADKKIRFKALKKDGQEVSRNTVIAEISGRASAVLNAERTALNILGHLSGIATLTKKFTAFTSGSKINITDTRKTLPLLRQIQKYAVRTGGGVSHRMDLGGHFLIKDNHLELLRKKEGITNYIEKALLAAKKNNKKRKIIEIEVRNLKEFRQALIPGPDIIMLDNMSIKQIKAAMDLKNKINPAVKIEVSGGITITKIKKLSSLKIDYISIGLLTHSAKSIDVSLELT